MTPETLPPAADRPDPANHRRPSHSEDDQLPPSGTKAQAEARRRADQMLFDTYPGQVIAFVDRWTGNTLEREIVTAATEVADFQVLLSQLDPAIRRRVEMVVIPGPEEDCDCPSVWLT